MTAPVAPAPLRTLVIACGALAREVLQARDLNGWDHLSVRCLPAKLHNRPSLIPGEIERVLLEEKGRHERILCLYGDCGTGGLLDDVLKRHRVERIGGAHCYEFYLGSEEFSELAEKEPATFFLTDYLVRHFERLVIEGLGLDRFPQLMADYFGNYRQVVFLAQSPDPDLRATAAACAARLNLPLVVRDTGLGGLERFLAAQPAAEPIP